MKRLACALSLLLPLLGWTAPLAAGEADAALYAEHCASCHGADRLGGKHSASRRAQSRPRPPGAARSSPEG